MSGLVLIKNVDLEAFAQQAITLGLREAGYAVILRDDPRAANAWFISVDVTDLWLSVRPVEGAALSHRFEFRYETRISSDVPELAALTTVAGRGSLESKKPSKPRWYQKVVGNRIVGIRG